MKKIYIPQGGGRDFWLRIPMNNESAGRHLCMDDVHEEDLHVWLESGYGGCWTLEKHIDGGQRDGIAAKVPASTLGYGTYSVVMAGKFVNGDYFRTKRQLFIRLVDREDQADAEPTMYNEEQAYWAGPAVLSEMLSRDGLNTYELWILQGNEGSLEDYLSVSGLTLNDFMVKWNHLSVDVQTKIQRGEEKGIEVKGDYSATTTYDVNDLVFDPTTNSSYISKHASNTGNALTNTEHWMKTMDGSDVLRAIEDADDATDAANTAAATAEDAAGHAVTALTNGLVGYYECGSSTSKAASQTKTVDDSNDYIMPTQDGGGAMKIKMYQVNTYAPTEGNPVKLKIGSETAKELLYNHEPVSASNSWEDGETISVYYDGTYYQASNAQGGSNKKIDAYLLGDLRTLTVGQNYEKDEVIKTSDKQIVRVAKEIKPLSLKEEVAVGDLRTNGTFENAATYQAQSAVNIYTGNDSGYTDGAYAIGSYAEYVIVVTAGNAAGNIKINGTDITITEGETAAEIASAIASNVTIDGWTLSANDNTVTVKCNTIGNNTTSITFADTDSTGVTVSGNTAPSTTGTDVVRVYNSGTWTNAVLADYIADVWVSKDASWLGTISNHVVAQDTARQDQTVIEEKLIFNQNRTFGSGDTSYMSSPAAGFELGKKYKIVATLNKTSSAAVGIYKRKIAANNNPNVTLAYIAAGTTTVTSYHTPTDKSTNYQYISAYASGTRSNLTWTVKIYEIVYKYLPEVKTELEKKIADVDAKIETNESDNVKLVMSNNYVRQNIVMNNSTLVWQTASAGYFSRLIQMEDGIYTLERVSTKPMLYAIIDSQYQHIGAVPTFIRARTATSASTVEVEGKKGWWLYVRDDDSSYTYSIPNIYFRRKDKFEVTNDAVDEVKYEKVLLDAGTVSTSYGVVANRDNANLGNLVSTTGSYKATDYIDISDYDKIQFTHLASGYQNTQQNTGAVFYDDTKTPITDYCFYRHMGAWGNATYTIDRPSNVKYIRTTLASTEATSRVYGYKERSNSSGSDEGSTPKIIRRNTDAIEAIYAAKKLTKQAVGGSYNYNDPNHMLNFCIAHISDIHTDTERYINFRQFVDNVAGIDAAIHTGDTVINSVENQYNSIKSVSGEKPVMDCVGNHDRGTANTSDTVHTPSLTTLKTWMRMDNLYYYKDFTKNEPVKNTLCYKIRVIVLNQYDFESDGTTHMSSLNATSIYSQTQLDWLVSTLQDALTNGYAVMIGMHTFDGSSWNCFKTNNKKFYDRIIARQDGAPFSGNKVIEDLINAFKNGSSINQTYTYADGSTATVNTSFASQGTFIAYMIGHGHRDIIAYSSNYPDQLYLGVNTGCLRGGYADRPYGTELSALARQAGDKSEDCFNVYGIDMKAKTVRVVRVGATLDDYFNKIDYDIYSF